MESCVVRLSQIQGQLPPAERRVAQYFIDNTMEIVGQPIEQVADACATSKTTVVRVCKQLGYQGYKAFCTALAADLATGGQNRLAYADVRPGDDLDAIIHTVTQHNRAAVEDTARILSKEWLKKAVEAIIKASRVDFYGVGASGIVALDAQEKFFRVGKNSQSSLDPHVQVVLASCLKHGDVAVFFSYSGETLDTLDTFQIAKNAGATVISVTRYGNCRLSRAADIPLYVATTEMLVRSSAMSSRIAMMHVVDILFSAAATQAYQEYKPYLDITHMAGREKRRAQRERRR